jgi:anti-sigma factor RsiW
MTGNKHSPISNDDLHAYADGKLPCDRVAEIEAFQAKHPAAPRQVEDYRAINQALHETFDPVLEEPIPALHVDLALHRRPRVALPIAAALAGLLVGASSGWLSHGYLSRDQLVAEELAARTKAAYVVYAPEIRHPVEVSANDSDHLAAWLSNRMGMAFQIPQLADLGFTLVGGRLMIGETAPAALLMYENGQGRRLVLYVRNDLPEVRQMEMRYERSAGTGVLYWMDGSKGFGLSGGFSEQELTAAAQLVRAQYAS